MRVPLYLVVTFLVVVEGCFSNWRVGTNRFTQHMEYGCRKARLYRKGASKHAIRGLYCLGHVILNNYDYRVRRSLDNLDSDTALSYTGNITLVARDGDIESLMAASDSKFSLDFMNDALYLSGVEALNKEEESEHLQAVKSEPFSPMEITFDEKKCEAKNDCSLNAEWEMASDGVKVRISRSPRRFRPSVFIKTTPRPVVTTTKKPVKTTKPSVTSAPQPPSSTKGPITQATTKPTVMSTTIPSTPSSTRASTTTTKKVTSSQPEKSAENEGKREKSSSSASDTQAGIPNPSTSSNSHGTLGTSASTTSRPDKVSSTPREKSAEKDGKGEKASSGMDLQNSIPTPTASGNQDVSLSPTSSPVSTTSTSAKTSSKPATLVHSTTGPSYPSSTFATSQPPRYPKAPSSPKNSDGKRLDDSTATNVKGKFPKAFMTPSFFSDFFYAIVSVVVFVLTACVTCILRCLTCGCRSAPSLPQSDIEMR